MPFNPSAYGKEVEEILALDGSGQRLMPLAHGRCSLEEARRRLGRVSANALFPNAPAPEAALSGLWLYFSCLEESHSLSQKIQTPDGSFWHGIMHRQEPDASNSGYWFRRVGNHPVFGRLLEEARLIAQAISEAGVSFGPTWDPFAFIELCEQARRERGSPRERLALEVQRAEWQLLFDHCARSSRA
jgi:hypothetical protein